MKTARDNKRGAFLLFAAAVAVIVFGVWCASLLSSVKILREELETRVGWLSLLQKAQSETDAMPLAEHRPALIAAVHSLLAESEAFGPLLPAPMLQELRARGDKLLQHASPTEEERHAYSQTSSQVISLLRRQNGAISAELGSKWNSLSLIIFVALLFATSNIILLRVAQRRNLSLQQTKDDLERELSLKVKIEAELRASQVRYQLAVDGSQDGIWDWDLITNQIYYSPRWFAQLGLKEAPPTPELWLSLVHPDDIAGVQARLDALLHGDAQMFECEYRIKHEEHGYLWVYSRGSALRQDGRAIRAAGSQTDVTQRRELAAIEEKTSILDQAVGVFGIGVLVVTPSNEVSFAGASIAGLSAPWGSVTSLWSSILSSVEFPLQSPCQSCKDLVPQGKAELRLLSPQREVLVYSLIFAGHAHHLGKGQDQIIFVQDLSERERLQVQLQQADRLASLGSLSSGIAHEINNPLTYILLNLESVAEYMRTLAPSEQLEDATDCLSQAREGATRVRRIVQDIKLFSKPSQERLFAVNPLRVIQASIRIAETQVKNRFPIRSELPVLPYVMANESALGQVLLTLLLNAAQSLPRETRKRYEIKIKAYESEQQVCVEVSDNGPGIEPAHLSRIFDPFFAPKADISGAGLGLSICHRLITSMNGTVTAKSTLGEGSSFLISLPAIEAPAKVEPQETPITKELTPKKILLVDDEPPILMILQKLLSQHTLHFANNGQEALELINREGPFDLILSDLNMPVQNGEELYYNLLQRDPAQAKKIVFMSGGSFVSSDPKFPALLEGNLIEKPFELSALFETLQRKIALIARD